MHMENQMKNQPNTSDEPEHQLTHTDISHSQTQTLFRSSAIAVWFVRRVGGIKWFAHARESTVQSWSLWSFLRVPCDRDSIVVVVVRWAGRMRFWWHVCLLFTILCVCVCGCHIMCVVDSSLFTTAWICVFCVLLTFFFFYSIGCARPRIAHVHVRNGLAVHNHRVIHNLLFSALRETKKSMSSGSGGADV